MRKFRERIDTDVLIIGGGIAGGTAALELADAGIKVLLVSRATELSESNTRYAQGGIVYKAKENDSAEKLSADILRAGAGLSNIKAVRILSREGPKLVERILIERLNVDFDRDGSELLRSNEGGHSTARIIYHADETGKAIESALVSAVMKHRNILVLPETTAVDLLTPAHHSSNRLAVYEPLSCVGAYLLDQRSGKVARCLARFVVLATGGLGQIFEFTANPEGARGDGIAMANRAGARIVNLEYIQFHPTAFYHIGAPRHLITEAARGDGAKLVDRHGTIIMEKYDPNGDLATRDIVARSIYQEMMATGASHVYLDFRTYIPKERILKHFPTIRETLQVYGVDILKDPVPVVPAAHYSCGGVLADVETGETNVKNLYAVGEVACTGLHGANRLASTSLLEGLVWGARSAAAIMANKTRHATGFLEDISPWQSLAEEIADPSLIAQDLRTIRGIMWNYVGLERTTPRLARARIELGQIERSVELFYQNSEMSDSLLGLRNIVRTAILVAKAAWENKQSAGCHFRK
jgi:L-aspartate oxidase